MYQSSHKSLGMMDDSDAYENDSTSSKFSCRDQTKKQNHSEIEKRRRDKMNKYITELSSVIPTCNSMSRKLDKLTVLRMAVQHMKTLHGSLNSYVEAQCKPSFISDKELKHLILQVADGFLFVASCDRGRFMFVSESVSRVLEYSQGDLIGQSWFDILHPKDIATVKEQLSSSESSTKERLVDDKTMFPSRSHTSQRQTLSPGSRRSFFCRMKYKSSCSVKEEIELNTNVTKKRKLNSADRRYRIIHCTGYLKSWASSNLSVEKEKEMDNSCNLCCLVAIGRVQQTVNNSLSSIPEMMVRPTEFSSRYSMDGKFIFVDQRVTVVVGYLPQELVGTSCYEYIYQDDIMYLSNCHRQVLRTKESVSTGSYRFQSKQGYYITLQSKWKAFYNPWTKELEYITSINTLVQVSSCQTTENVMIGRTSNCSSSDTILSYLPTAGIVSDGHNNCSSGISVCKIGQQIANEVIGVQKMRNSDLKSDNIQPKMIFPSQKSNSSSILGNCLSGQNFQFTGATHLNPPHSFEAAPENYRFNNVPNEVTVGVTAPELQMASYRSSSCEEGNDEAAMAVIMSLLEADAGLGGPVDFSGLPWPLL